MGAPPAVHGVRARRLLRQLAQPACDGALARPARPSVDQVVRTGRELVVVLPGRALLRSRWRAGGAVASLTTSQRFPLVDVRSTEPQDRVQLRFLTSRVTADATGATLPGNGREPPKSLEEGAGGDRVSSASHGPVRDVWDAPRELHRAPCGRRNPLPLRESQTRCRQTRGGREETGWADGLRG